MTFFSSLRALCRVGIRHSARGLLIAFQRQFSESTATIKCIAALGGCMLKIPKVVSVTAP
jgi:hypothetical protein